MLIAGFWEVDIVGTCGRLDDLQAPVWSAVHLTNVEVVGAGTVTYDQAKDEILPHIHVTVGLKQHSATAHTSHLLSATVQLLSEMLIIEVTSPTMRRRTNPDLYNVPQLHFGVDATEIGAART